MPALGHKQTHGRPSGELSSHDHERGAVSQLCTWCGSEFETQVTGRSVKRFCSKSCRQSFHAACRIWGEEAHGAGAVSILQLRTCFARRACRTERDPALGGAQVASEATKDSGGPLAATVGLTA